MKKNIFALILPFTIFGFIALARYYKKNQSPKAYIIDLLKTASHPALDAVQDGFIDTIKKSYSNTITCRLYNAQGSGSHIHALAQQIQSNQDSSAYVAIATPAAQALYSVEKKRPIIIAAVSDPKRLGLLHPMSNVCGVHDTIDYEIHMHFIKTVFPAAKTVGVLYTSGTLSALSSVERIKKAVKKASLTSLDFAIQNELDIQTVIDLACRKTDVLIAPTDNTIAVSIPLISRIATSYKKPFIASDALSAPLGAFAACGVNYYAIGCQAAHIAYKVLADHKKPYTIPLAHAEQTKIQVNKKILDALEITIPPSLSPTISMV